MRCFISGEECQHHMKEDPKSVFVISPFGYPFDDIYKRGIVPYVGEICCGEVGVELPGEPNEGKDLKLQLSRADQAFQLGFIMCQRICRRIQNALFVIADVTRPNPNVFYELGLSYGLNKKIILIGQKSLSDAFTFGLVKNNESYIQYRSLEDFNRKDMFVNAFKKPVVNVFGVSALPKAKILNIVNEEHSIKGLYHSILKESIEDLKKGKNWEEMHYSSEEKGRNPGDRNDSEKQEESESKLKNDWEVATRSISFNSKIDEMISDFQDCKIAVVDSSFYGSRDTDLNPYLFFCLGLGHGFQKEVVPLTNTPTSANILPFDVRGLWHIFFRDLKQLKNQFMSIMPEIDCRWSDEKKNYLHREIWDPILKEGDLYIMTCARDDPGDKDKIRGPRTNIDKWDYTSVSEIAKFIGKNYPNATVNIWPPRSKRSNEEINELGKDKVEKDVANDLNDKNCIIIGSPDVSDYAEIVLAKLLKIKPYEKEHQIFKGYAIIKGRRPVTSSFYWEKSEKEKEGVCIPEMEFGKDYIYYVNSVDETDNSEKVYGILTIANNPFVSPGKKRKIMILSGYSGIATYAIAKLLTSEEIRYVKELGKLYENYRSREKDVQILFGTKFTTDKKTKGKGDNRTLDSDKARIFFKEMITIEKFRSSNSPSSSPNQDEVK